MSPVAAAAVLVGRDDELALLDGLLREAARGRGAAVLIEGEPGIGKSALVHAAVTAADGPGPAEPLDEQMLDWLARTGDQLVSQAPGVAAELLAPSPRLSQHRPRQPAVWSSWNSSVKYTALPAGVR